LSIDVGNSFNCEHPDKFKDQRVVNSSINVGNSFNSEQPDKSNDLSRSLATISAAGVDKSHATLSLLLMSNSSSFAAMSTTLEAF
jgi:hypothetical protein